MNSPPPLLNISDLHLEFITPNAGQKVLNGVTLQIKNGESLALVGESGSGKSITALSILGLLGGYARITHGSISFDGESIHDKTSQQLLPMRGKKIGMIFQDPMTSLNPTLNVGWQIAETLVFHEKISTSDARLKAIELLNLVGIGDAKARYDAYPFQLSGGMRQRVMIAIALACNPKLLIADEPTTALDVTVQAQIFDLLQKIRREKGMALLLITHDLSIVRGMCEHIAVMQHGKVVETSSVESLFANPVHPYTQTLIAAKSRAYSK